MWKRVLRISDRVLELFSSNSKKCCSCCHCECHQSNENLEEANGKVYAQSIFDVFKFTDREVIDKIIEVIKVVDTKKLQAVMDVVSVKDGTLHLEFDVKLRNGE